MGSRGQENQERKGQAKRPAVSCLPSRTPPQRSIHKQDAFSALNKQSHVRNRKRDRDRGRKKREGGKYKTRDKNTKREKRNSTPTLPPKLRCVSPPLLLQTSSLFLFSLTHSLIHSLTSKYANMRSELKCTVPAL